MELKRKRVFIISSGQIVKGKSAGSQRVLNLAKSMASGGVMVYLISYLNVSTSLTELIKLDHNIFYLRDIGRRNRKEILHIIRFLKTVKTFISKDKNGIAIYLYPTVFTCKDWIYLVYFKLINRYPFFCDINELRVASISFSRLKNSLPYKIKLIIRAIINWGPYKLSEFQAYFCDGIIVISTRLEAYFSRFNKRILRIPILCDAVSEANENHLPSYSNDNFKICFAGYLKGSKEGFDNLFEALAKVNAIRRVELYLYGILPREERVIMDYLIRRFQLENRVFYMGNIAPDDLHSEFLKYHLLILPRPDTRQAEFGFSTKLGEYLLSGIPVLITDVSDNALYIKDGYNGYIIPPGSVPDLVDKILDIAENYNLHAGSIAENARKTAAENFHNSLFTGKLNDFLFYDNCLKLK